MRNDDRFAQISAVQARYSDLLLQKLHVIGVGIGNKKVNGKLTDDLALVVMVDKKVPIAQLAAEDIIPAELDGISVDVQSMGGEFKAL